MVKRFVGVVLEEYSLLPALVESETIEQMQPRNHNYDVYSLHMKV